ncbi:MAG: DUF2254 domain-containing protein [Acidobacteriota bacterium]
MTCTIASVMKIPLPSLIERVRGSLWFVPAIMTLASISLAFLLIWADHKFSAEVIRTLGWTYSGGPEGAREVLATIAASMITVAGVVFSVTVVALSLASQQFGPRMLRNFMQDRGNQIVLGTFIATFIFCLLVLRTVRGTDGSSFVPHIAVTTGVLLAMASLGVLIFFIHHVSLSIQAEQVIGEIAAELDRIIENIYPQDLDGGEADSVFDHHPELFGEGSAVVRSEGSGFIQAINAGRLTRLAREHGVVVRLKVRPGQFLFPGSELAEVSDGAGVDASFERKARESVVLGRSRTPTQDILFPIDQLVEIAVRSLSPSVNDPFTAVSALYRLGSALSRLTTKRTPSPMHFDEEDQLCVIAPHPSFEELVNAALEQIRLEGRSKPFVMKGLITTLHAVLNRASEPSRRAILLAHAERIRLMLAVSIEERADRDELMSYFRERIGGADATADPLQVAAH